MNERDHKSGGNSVAIVVAICLVLFLLVPCGLVVFGGLGFLVFRSAAPNQMIIEEAMPTMSVEKSPSSPAELRPDPENVQPVEEPPAILPPAVDPTATEPPVESAPSDSRN